VGSTLILTCYHGPYNLCSVPIVKPVKPLYASHHQCPSVFFQLLTRRESVNWICACLPSGQTFHHQRLPHWQRKRSPSAASTISQIKSYYQHAVRFLPRNFFLPLAIYSAVTSLFCLSMREMPKKWLAPFAFFTATLRKSEPVTLLSGSTNIPPPPWREVMSIDSGIWKTVSVRFV
jgi:hypothetical protein